MIPISTDGKGSWRDNVFAERRTVKDEKVYLRAYQNVAGARSSIGRYLEFYNRRRPHSALDWRTPDRAYYASLPAAWQHSAPPLTLAGVPLNDTEILFKESDPPLRDRLPHAPLPI
jgi:hypothetical protein